MPHTLTEQAHSLLIEIHKIQVEEMGRPALWDKAGRDIFAAAEQMFDIIKSLDTEHRLRRIEDAIRESNPRINI